MNMSVFFKALRDLQSLQPQKERRWVYVAYDQLNAELEPLASTPAEELGLVLIESQAKGRRRAYHKQKLLWVLASQRHFALEQARRGVHVRYAVTSDDYATCLRKLSDELGPLEGIEPAERELRTELQALVDEGLLSWHSHSGWLSCTEDFLRSQRHKEGPWRMDAFYRFMRKKTGLLMDGGTPWGGRYSFDDENREPWSGEPPAPEMPNFEPDAITQEVAAFIASEFSDHPGALHPEHVAASAEDVDALWCWAKEACMTHFGPYEDAMSHQSRGVFHTRISAALNLHRLMPARVIEDVCALEIPLNSKEGFVRQVLGWREFMRHVHRQTDGFRDLPGSWAVLNADRASPNFLEVFHDLPPAYWGEASGLTCLDTVVESVLDEGYSHHITRLMVLANLATLLDVDPGQITNWFWEFYIDAYDWVVEPNVLGMGVFALGDLFTTKPYISGANYIAKMSDYCGKCAFDPGSNCPIRSLYWAFLARHEAKLREQGRMNLVMGSLRRRSDEQRVADARVFEVLWAHLQRGELAAPAAFREKGGQASLPGLSSS
ncbi:deoxyribodipyrimidine photolyase [Lujinxingia sediminis]|uniref:Deoxyribodipyrimidine photolyase n=2 Tax=Lujinxingia sediminis TaxID=2480984 RepID=A0ABY0CRJ5_9DELT|nr:deoxyribodipyrimidine photolyase [Lujinxingia sediminis]